MKKLSVKEILNHPELAQYIMPQNCGLFLIKNKDYEEVANVANTSVTDAYLRIMDQSQGRNIEELFQENNDAKVTEEYAKSINGVFRDYHSKISADKLMLYIALTSIRTLQSLNRAYSPDYAFKGNEEVFFENGDYVAVNGQDVRGQINGKEVTTTDDLRNRLARVILIAANQFSMANNQKGKKGSCEIAGMYYHSGISGGKDKIKFSEKELLDFSRSAEIISSFSNADLVQAISEGLTNKNILLKHLEKGKIERKAAVDFMEYGVITEDDFVRRVYKKKNINEVAEDPTVDPLTKIILFNNNRISLETFKKIADFSLAFKAYAFKSLSIEDFQSLVKSKGLEPQELSFVQDWNMVAVAYKDRPKQEVITDITELLTHDIFDYTHSMQYLDYMKKREIITEEDQKYIEGVMRDFKTNELVNNAENELIEVTGEGNKKVQPYVSSLTIDPQVRINYLTSLGAVKKLRVKGETFMHDSQEARGKRNSLDGYEMFIIPSKKIAVLEKLYETTRDKNDNIVYRKNRKGELIPAVENATYIMPIEMAKEFVEKKNKRELIKSPYVERSMHTADWVISTERKIRKVRPEVEFDRENSQKWCDLVRQNYQKNKEERTKE